MKNKGFTLFELLVSISIVGILMAVASMSYSSAQRKARDTRRMGDMNDVQKAAEQFYSLSNYNYPTTWGVGTSWAVNGQTILEAMPMDPKGIAYTAPASSASSYCLCAVSENNTGNSTDNNCSFTAAGTKDWYCVRNQQ